MESYSLHDAAFEVMKTINDILGDLSVCLWEKLVYFRLGFKLNVRIKCELVEGHRHGGAAGFIAFRLKF